MNTFFIVMCLVVLAGVGVCALTGVWVIIRRIMSLRKSTRNDMLFDINHESNDHETNNTIFEVNQSDKININEVKNKSDVSIIRKNLSVRFAIVGVIIVILLIPLSFVKNLTWERSILYHKVVEDISRTSGGMQLLSGPYLLIPFTKRHHVKDAITVTVDYLVLLPEELSFSGQLQPEERRRGIYRSLVYTADVTMQGRFVLPLPESLERVAPNLIAVDYAKAFVVMGLEYPGAVREAGAFMWNATPLKAEPGTQPFAKLKAGFRVPVRLSRATEAYTFSQHLVFSGSGGIRVTPAGEHTSISFASPWPHPSFQGDILPHEREVSDRGFTASWSIPSLARPFPGLSTVSDWPSKSKKQDISVGLDFFESQGHYQLVQRSVKYGILFISLTFLAFMVFEMSRCARLHPVQYGLVGLAMVVFYLVLLSLAEHIAFSVSYAVAAICTICMISMYSGAALRSIRQGGGVGLLLVALYALLYAILQMEDYALLMGTVLVVIMLGALMVVSRNMDRN